MHKRIWGYLLRFMGLRWRVARWEGLFKSLLGDRIAGALGPGSEHRVGRYLLSAWLWWRLPHVRAVIMSPAFAVMESAGPGLETSCPVSTPAADDPQCDHGAGEQPYRLLAWGMMPVGLVLSGVIVSLAEIALLYGQVLGRAILVARRLKLARDLAVWSAISKGDAEQRDSALKRSGRRPTSGRQRQGDLTGQRDWLKPAGLRPTATFALAELLSVTG